MRRRLAAFGAALCAAASGAWADPSAQRISVVQFHGLINARHVDLIRSAVGLARGDVFPTRMVVMIDSLGGDGLAAIAIGRLLREMHAHVFVTGRCASACVFVLAGGVVRSARPYTVGVHRGKMVAKARPNAAPGSGGPSEERLREMLANAEQSASRYLVEMGLPPTAFDTMQSIANDRVRWLSLEETDQLGLTGYDSDWLRRQSAELEADLSVKPPVFLERLGTAHRACEPENRKQEDFVACYKAHLLGRPLPARP